MRFSHLGSSHQRHLLASVLAGVLMSVAAVANATDVQFSDGGYTFAGAKATLKMSAITNYSSSDSGTLRMELWAFTSPWTGVAGSVQDGFPVAVSLVFGPLDADSYYTTSPLDEITTFKPPVNGTYYMTLFLDEYQGGAYDDGYEAIDYVNFASTETFAFDGVSFGISSATPVGYGYWYDSDLQYIYPYGDGWMYLSSLDHYFYVYPGSDFTTGAYIYDLSHSSWTYTERSFWPAVYYYDGTGWVSTGFN